MKNSGKKVFVGMSGGVDSSVAAYLLKKQGYGVVGVSMRCYNLDGCAERDAEDARRVAEKLQIPFYVWDFEEEYKKKVVDYMIDGYRRGITPNPDVMCNREIKFGLFLEKALALGADYVAAGHYVRIKKQELRIKNKKDSLFVIHNSLFSARDEQKDQSYFLWTLTPKQLKHCLFPIGDYLKSEVREIARRTGLPTAGKKDSQGICFLGKITLDEFLKKYIPEKRGPVLLALSNAEGTTPQKIGEHSGAHFYTIGQRHGLNHETWNMKRATSARNNRLPFYVAEKDTRLNTLVVAEGAKNPALYKKEVKLTDVNFINPRDPGLIRTNGGIKVLARVRYRQPFVPAKLVLHASGFMLHFDSPVKFVAAGQSAVFYSKSGEMLGGGIIE